MDARPVLVEVLGQTANQALPLSGPLVEAALKELLSIEDEQVMLLRDIEKGVQRLLDGPWKHGHLALEEATLPGRTEDNVGELLKEAQVAFRKAIPLQPDPSLSAAQVSIDLAFICRVRGDLVASAHYARKGYVTARAAMRDLVRSIKLGVMSGLPKNDGDYTRVRQASQLFADLEFAAAALGDPDARPSYPKLHDEQVEWPEDRLLCFEYLVRRRESWPEGERLARLNGWTEFQREGDIVNTPKKWPLVQGHRMDMPMG